MAGGIIDLVCRGVEDLWLSGDAQITMFKIAYRRYSNFYMETQKIPLTGRQTLAKENPSNQLVNYNILAATLPKIGDAVGKVYLKVKLPQLAAIYDDTLLNTINNLLAKYNIVGFTDATTLTYANINQKIDDKLTEISNNITFYNELISEFNVSKDDNRTVPANLRVLKQILQLAETASTEQDDIYFLIYNAILQGTQAKTETVLTLTTTTIVGPYDLLAPPDLSGYTVSLKNEMSNKLKGETHVIMTEDEIVKGFQRAIEQLMFSDNPSDMKFIYKFYNTNLNFISTRGINGATKLINIFDTILNLGPNVSDVTATLTVTHPPIENMIDQPFYERYSGFGFETTNYKQLDAYKYIIHYLNLNGSNVERALFLRSTTVVSDATIRMLITDLFNEIKLKLWGVTISNFLVNIGIFISLGAVYGSNMWIKLKNWTTTPLPDRVNNLSEFSDLYAGLNLLSDLSYYTTDTEQNVPSVAIPYNAQGYDKWIRQSNYGYRNAIFNNGYFSLTQQNEVITIVDFINFIQTSTTINVTDVLFPTLGPLSASVKTPDFDPTRLAYLDNYDVFVNTTLLKLKKHQFDLVVNAQGDGHNFDLVFNSFVYSPLMISYILGKYLNDPTHPFNYDALGDPFYSNNYYMYPDPNLFALQTSAIPLGLRLRNPEGALVIMMRYISNYILGVFNTIDPTHVNTDVNNAIDYINRHDTKLAYALTAQIFPRFDDTLPYSNTNDSYFVLARLIMNSYGSKIVDPGDGYNNFINLLSSIFGWTQQIVVQLDTFILYYAILQLYIPTHMFVTASMYNKSDQITNAKIINMYVSNIAIIKNTSTTTNILTNGLTFAQNLDIITNKLGILKAKTLASSNDKLSLSEFTFEDVPVVPLANYNQTNIITPLEIKMAIAYTQISNLLSFVDPSDVDSFLTSSSATSTLTSPVIIETTDEKIDNSLEFLVRSSVGLREFMNAQQKKNYNDVYKNSLMGISMLKEKIGINTSNRMDAYFTMLLKNYNLNVFSYNATNPFIKVDYIGDVNDVNSIATINDVNNITFNNDLDYTLFGVMPNDYTFTYPILGTNTSQLFVTVENDSFAKVVKNVLGYVGNNGTIIDDINKFISRHNAFNGNRKLLDLISIEPMPLSSFFSKQESIYDYYYNTLASINNVPPFDLTPGGVIVTFMKTYFNFIHNNFYTVEELYLYLKNYCLSVITMSPDDLVKFNLFFNSINPVKMVANLQNIEANNPDGFRFTNAYIMFVIQELFKNVSYLDKVNLKLMSNFDQLKDNYTNILNGLSSSLTDLRTNKIDILNLFNYRNSVTSGTLDYARCAWVENIGINIMENIKVKFSGQVMEMLDTDSIYMLNLIENDIGNQRGYDKMIGNVSELITFDNTVKNEYVVKVPLPFFFTKKPNTHLIYVSMLYQDIDIVIETKSIDKLVNKDLGSHLVKVTPSKNATKPPIVSRGDFKVEFDLQVEYFYMDNKERMSIASNPQEYLMEYVQSGDTIYVDRNSLPDENKLNVKMTFPNPCKYMFWIAQTKYNVMKNRWQVYGYDLEEYNPVVREQLNYEDNKTQILGNSTVIKRPTPYNYTNRLIIDKVPVVPYTTELVPSRVPFRKHIFSAMSLEFNSVVRFRETDMDYYNYIQPRQHCKNDFPDGAGVYSFAVDMNHNQPTGQCNFGRLDRLRAIFTINPEMVDIINNFNEYIRIKIMYRGYNILRYFSGFAGWGFYE